jgi:hypothetical protein
MAHVVHEVHFLSGVPVLAMYEGAFNTLYLEGMAFW